MPSALATKMGLRSGMRAILVGAPATVARQMRSAGADLRTQLRGGFDHIHFFATRSAPLDRRFPRLRDRLNPGGRLWISWPRARQLATDLTLPEVIRIGYDHGLVESKTIGVDETWAAIKFTAPRAGKTYRNSYGTLKRKR
jgi:hypothetical protein